MLNLAEEEMKDTCEKALANKVRTICGAMNTIHNPFHVNPCEPKEPLKTNPSLSKSGARHAVIQSTSSFSTASKKSTQFPAPAVAFPYILELSPYLEASFALASETLPALPCEVESKWVRVPGSLPAARKTLVLGLEDTLVMRTLSEDPLGPESQPKGLPLFQTRPFAIEFISRLSKCFEIIVNNASNS